MACPHVAGIAAILLQARKNIGDMPRNGNRVEALFSALKSGCISLGLPKTHQGVGMPSAVKLGIAEGGEANNELSALDRLDQILTEALLITREKL